MSRQSTVTKRHTRSLRKRLAVTGTTVLNIRNGGNFSLFSIFFLCLLRLLPASAGSFGDNLWNVKFFGCDDGHDNSFILQRDGSPVCGSGNCPGAPGSCWGPLYTQNRYINGGNFDWSVGSFGALHVHQDHDYQIYADTWLYVNAAKTLQVPFVADVGRMWLDDVDVTPNAVGNVIPLPLSQGWNHLEITTYNQNQGAQNEINFAFATQVDRISSNTNGPATNGLPIVQANYGWLFCGDIVQGTIGFIGQTNSYAFNGDAGEVVRLTVSPVSQYAYQFGMQAEVFNGTNYLGTFGVGNLSLLTLPATTTYTVRVHDYADNNTGTYTLSLEFANGRCTTPIVCGQVVTNQLIDPVQVDTYTFSGNAGEIVRLVVSPVSQYAYQFGMQAEVFNGTNYLGAFGMGNLSSLTLPTTGTYTVWLHDYSFSHMGAYTMNLVYASDRCATPIVCGQIVTNQLIDPVQVDTYTFSGNAGEVLRVGISPISQYPYQFGMEAEVFNGTNYLGAFGMGNLSSLTLPATGMYHLWVHDYGNDNMGSYSMQLTVDGGCVQLSSAVVISQQLRLTILGEAGRTYRLDTSTNLTTWSTGQVLGFTAPYMDFVVSNFAKLPRQFYRAVLLPQ